MKNNQADEEDKLRSLLNTSANSFTVPDGYFEKLPESILDKINSLPDLEKNTSLNPFAVPENYFESLPSEISEKITRKNTGLYGRIREIQRPRIIIPAAFATLILLAALFYYTQRNVYFNSPTEFAKEELNDSEIIMYLDEELLVESIHESTKTDDIESLEEYLIENNIETSQIENEL
jgi:hypothetical protein